MNATRSSARWLTVVAALTLCAVVAGCGGPGSQAARNSGAELDQVTVQLDYVPRGNHAMFYVAKAKGFFADQGIEVTEIRTGKGSADAMRIVGGGAADFGFGDLPTLAKARSQNAPVVALAAVNQHSPLAMCSKANKHPLNAPKNLIGLTVGIHPGQSTFVFYQAFLAANGMKRSQVEERTLTPPFANYLLQDRVDAIPCYIDAEVPELEAKAGGEGSLSILLGSDHGYDVYGSGLFTSDKLVKEKPDLVQRFVNAYLKAFRFVIDNPEQAAEILSQASPELQTKKQVFVEQLKADIQHTFTSPATKEHGLGYMTEEAWQTTLDTLEQQKVLENVPPVDSLYDTSFVEKAAGQQ